MDYLAVAVASLVVAALTLVSGFGLGSLLMPVFALLFPLDVAVGATAVVHLANNLFKLGLVGKYASWPVAIRFGVPAIPAAFVGAMLLGLLTSLESLWRYNLSGRTFQITSLALVMGGLIVVFSLLDLFPVFDRLTLDRRYLPVGGVLSGLFGGISGHQGALRAAFLIQCGLVKEAFIGTNVICAVAVDVTRLSVYGTMALKGGLESLRDVHTVSLVVTATLSAFLGSFVGARVMHKVTMALVRRLVGILLLVLGTAIALGLV